MSHLGHLEAVYRHGLFVPLEAVDLRNEQRVSLDVELSDADNCWHWLRSIHAIQQAVVARRGSLPDSSSEIAADRQR